MRTALQIFAMLPGLDCSGTHSYASLFGIAAGAYLVALLMLVLFAPGLRKVELAV